MEGLIDSYSYSIMCWQFEPAPHLNNKVKVGILQILDYSPIANQLPFIVINNSENMVEYSCKRLCFRADIIEPLKDTDCFTIHTPNGTFQMTKSDFYRVFHNVVKSKSYQDNRIYHMSKPPQKALQFLKSDSSVDVHTGKSSFVDLVGEDIRQKIKEIAILWKTSRNNPAIDDDVLRHWKCVIEEWIEDEEMPLIVRKDTKYKGQSFIHPSGREIIVSDNTFAIWVYGRCMNHEIYTLKELKEKLFNNEIPMVYMLTSEIREKAKYTRPLGAFSLPIWKVCHIDSVGFNSNKTIDEIDITDIKNHFRKYASPYNIFVLPKEIGDLGEIQVFIDVQRR